jgi:nucleotide-binding universal stress UspA family protein
MERTILATLDGSELSQKVLHFLPAIVRPNDVIVLLTVRSFPAASWRTGPIEQPVIVGTSVASLEPLLPNYAEDGGHAIDRERAEAVDYLEDQAAFLRNEGLTVRTHAVFDDSPAHAIIEFARGLAPLFIAMATHGRGGLSHALHGSVAEQVVRSGVAPVLAVRP